MHASDEVVTNVKILIKGRPLRLERQVERLESSSGFFYQLRNAISTGLNGALSFILVLVTALIALLPFFLFIVLPIYLGSVDIVI